MFGASEGTVLCVHPLGRKGQKGVDQGLRKEAWVDLETEELGLPWDIDVGASVLSSVPVQKEVLLAEVEGPCPAFRSLGVGSSFLAENRSYHSWVVGS